MAEEFKIQNSKHLMFLDGLSDEEIVKRYFVKGDCSEWFVDFNKQWGGKEEREKYQIVKIFSPGSIGYFVSSLKQIYLPLLQEAGYKLNAENLFQDLDIVLCEHRQLALPARIKANPFLADLVACFATIIDKGYKCLDTESF